MKYKIRVRTIWEFGKRVDANGEPHQEDSLFPGHNKANDSDRLFILCDGMGGHDKGEVASSTVCEAMSSIVLKECPDAEGAFPDIVLQNALNNAYNALDAKDSGAQKKMGTTMTFLKLHSAGYTAAHIGDSRIYHFRPGKDKQTTEIVFKTEDHSLVNDLVKIGEITEEEAKVHPQRNVITRAMQPHNERRPKADVYHSSDIRPGDYFYLCSDGMLEQSDDNNLRQIFSDKIPTIEAKTDALEKVSLENKDNHTAFIIEILSIEERPTEVMKCDPGECPLLSYKMAAPAPLMAETSTPDMGMPVTFPEQPGIGAANFSPAPQMGAPVSPSGIMPKPKKDNRSNILLYILMALLAVVVVALVYVFFFKPASKPADNEPEEERIERTEEPSRAPSSAPAESAVPPAVRNETTVRIIKSEKNAQGRKPGNAQRGNGVQPGNSNSASSSSSASSVGTSTTTQQGSGTTQQTDNLNDLTKKKPVKQ